MQLFKARALIISHTSPDPEAATVERLPWTLNEVLQEKYDRETGEEFEVDSETGEIFYLRFDTYILKKAQAVRDCINKSKRDNIKTIREIGRYIRKLGDPRTWSVAYLNLLRAQTWKGRQLGLDF